MSIIKTNKNIIFMLIKKPSKFINIIIYNCVFFRGFQKESSPSYPPW